jgi:hypothetical protein
MKDTMESIAAVMPVGTLEGSAVWYGRDYKMRIDWTCQPSTVEIEEIDAAVRAAKTVRRDIIYVSRDNFDLPALGDRPRSVQDRVRNGRGLLLIRSLPVGRYMLWAAATADFGIGAHMGSARSQNAEGHVLGHVYDIGHKPEKAPARLSLRRSARFPYRFHGYRRFADLAEIASSVTVYYEILHRFPKLLCELFKPIHCDRRGEIPEGMEPWWTMPVYTRACGISNMRDIKTVISIIISSS